MKESLELETVKDFFDHLKLFIIDLQACIDNIDAIIDSQNNNLNLKPIELFLSHFVYMSYSHASINVYKIFKDGEKRGFYKLFNKLENFRYCDKLKNLLHENSLSDDSNLVKNKEDIRNAIKNIKAQINNKEPLLTKFKILRETYFAHTDPDKKFETGTLHELKEIRDLSISIYNNLYGKLFASYFMFTNNGAIIQPILDDRKFVDDYWAGEENKL